ncbi:MAG TPA: hypothetical protein VMF89_22135, partial [Polyangiales bacterium]|nr:hypothetical protein [Polyangiales bacterium]
MRYGSWQLRFLVLTVLGGACGDAAKSADSITAEDTTPSTEAQSGNARVDAAAGTAAAGSGTPPAAPTEPSANASAAGSGGAMGTAPSASTDKPASAQAGQGGDAAPGAPVTETGAAGSGETQPTAGQGAPTEPAARPRRAVSADFLGKTLSIVDVDKLKPGAKRADALLGSVDLSMFSPGPLAVAVTPDAKTAVVSISAGWLGLVGTEVPPGSGTLVFVDLETLTVKGDLNIGRDPMGILISKDGKHAYVGLMSETYMAYVDIEARSFERIATGNSWNEELAVDDTGTVAILTAGTAGNAVTFTPEDGAKSLGQTLGLNADAAGTAFFPGTKLAYVVQAPTQLTGYLGGYNVIDATDPASP